MFAKNRCRVASFSLRCLRLSERFSKKHVFSERMHSEVRRYLQFQMEDWNEHPNHVEMSTHRALCFILRTLNFELSEQFTWLQLSLASFSSIQTQGRCSPSFPLHMVLAGGSRPGAPAPAPSRDARRRPCTADVSQGAKHNSGRITRRRSPS